MQEDRKPFREERVRPSRASPPRAQVRPHSLSAVRLWQPGPRKGDLREESTGPGARTEGSQSKAGVQHLPARQHLLLR